MRSEAALPVDRVQPGNVAVDSSPVDQAPALTPAPTPTSKTGMDGDRNTLASNSQLTEVDPKQPLRQANEGEHPKAGRKTLEKERRAAERKRSRLEGMYQNHLISSEAYKKGEEEYKSEIEKYRSAVNTGRGVAE